MRTTLTLDEDVAAKLDYEVRHGERSFKETVNELLRTALTMRRAVKSQKPFEIKPLSGKPRPGIAFDDIEALLDQIDGPSRR